MCVYPIKEGNFRKAPGADTRKSIERLAAKTGSVAYIETVGCPNSTWDQEMGYGQIDLFRNVITTLT